MKLIIHDLSEKDFDKIMNKKNKNFIQIYNEKTIKKCIGCFGCWIANPCECVIKDGYENTCQLIGNCEELILITSSFYGSYSPFVKNVMDRSIGYVHPYFEIRNNETHHKARYTEQIKFSVYFYGKNFSNSEKRLCTSFVKANSLNLNSKESDIYFFEKYSDIRGKIK